MAKTGSGKAAADSGPLSVQEVLGRVDFEELMMAASIRAAHWYLEADVASVSQIPVLQAVIDIIVGRLVNPQPGIELIHPNDAAAVVSTDGNLEDAISLICKVRGAMTFPGLTLEQGWHQLVSCVFSTVSGHASLSSALSDPERARLVRAEISRLQGETSFRAYGDIGFDLPDVDSVVAGLTRAAGVVSSLVDFLDAARSASSGRANDQRRPRR